LVPAEHNYVSKPVAVLQLLQALEGGIDSSHVSWLHRDACTDPLMQGARGKSYNMAIWRRCSNRRSPRWIVHWCSP